MSDVSASRERQESRLPTGARRRRPLSRRTGLWATDEGAAPHVLDLSGALSQVRGVRRQSDHSLWVSQLRVVGLGIES